MIIAIQPDDYGPNDASSPTWSRLLRDAGHQVREVDVYRADILDQLRGCSGFMWRHGHLPQMRQVARRLLPVLERELGLVVYPDQNTCWHYDDKIAQSYLFEALDIPAPKTWVFFDEDAALGYAKGADYPLVVKLWAGASSTNVALVSNITEAEGWIRKLFHNGVADLSRQQGAFKKRFLDFGRLLAGRDVVLPSEVHRDYILFQEFVPDNAYDTRLTIVGNRAFGFRRFNRDDDFRASGSGVIDYDPRGIAPEFVGLAFDVAKKLKMQSCALDFLWNGESPVVVEVSYTYASWAVHGCPGHWNQGMQWCDGQMCPEEAHVEDFLARLEQQSGS